MSNPKVHPAILLSPVENGYVAYDPVRDELHQLNPVAALLTELCDGSRSVAEITTLAEPFLPPGESESVARWVAQATTAGLLTDADGQAAGHGELSAAELANLTVRLREWGKVQTAYICGKRAMELDPTNHMAWYNLGEIAHCLGKRDEARAAYEKYMEGYPDDGEVEHILIALRDETPDRASDRAIQHIYRNFAASYESRMVDELKYAGPQRMIEAVDSVTGVKEGLTVLDMGCGSGLGGINFRPRAASLTGIDLSPEMVELARARNLYDRLEVAEITEWLARDQDQFDLIVSTDCIIYFGDLTALVAAAARRLKPGGTFALSTELGDRAPFRLTDSGRYSHHPDHMRDVAQKAGLKVGGISEGFLRTEYGKDVIGLFTVLQKPA